MHVDFSGERGRCARASKRFPRTRNFISHPLIFYEISGKPKNNNRFNDSYLDMNSVSYPRKEI